MYHFKRERVIRWNTRITRVQAFCLIPGKVSGRVLIERVRELTEGLIGEEQCGF